MESLAAAAPIFPLFSPGHPLAEPVRRLATMVGEHLQEHGAPEIVHAEVKALPDERGGWRLDRFYWSGQRRDPQARGRLQAQTLAYRDGQGAAWHSFPRDPYLGDIGAALDALGLGDAAVLRYVPLRRLTFRATLGGRPVVGKFKRRSRFREADDRLAAVAAASGALAGELRVARPAGTSADHALALQEALPGRCLADTIDSAGAPALLAQLGALHAALHTLDVPSAPRWDPDAYRAATAHDIRWISFVRPELAAELAHVAALLGATAPDLRTGWRFCHGDMVPSQVLAGDGAWGVIDFDLCRIGDPHQELAALLAALPYDVPALRDADEHTCARACAAYLGGYAARSRAPVDARRLRWHRVCAELAYLGLGLKKGWLDQASLPAAVGRLRARVAELRQGGGQ